MLAEASESVATQPPATSAPSPTPSGSEVVCSKCGSHLGDYFPSGSVEPFEYYCIDGVCMLPPGAEEGAVCKPNITEGDENEAASKRLASHSFA